MFLALRMALYLVFGGMTALGLATYDAATGDVVISFNVNDLSDLLLGLGGFGMTFVSSFLDKLRGPVKT